VSTSTLAGHRHRFSIGAVNISLGSDCQSIVDEYLSLYAPYRRDRGDPPDGDAIEVEITSRRRKPWIRGPFTLRSSQASDFQVRSRHEVLPHLEWYINWQIINSRRDYLQLHASSLEIDNQAIIFPGDPGSGKTTLTAGMLSRGWSYLCDEFALIDPQTCLVHPYPRALSIKEGSFPIVDRLGLPLCRKTPYQAAVKGRVAFLNPLDLRTDVVGKPAPIRWVVFPNYVADATPALQPLTRSEAAHAMARQCFNARVYEARSLHIFAEVVRGAECYRLRSGDITATCRLIEQLVGTGGLGRARCA